MPVNPGQSRGLMPAQSSVQPLQLDAFAAPLNQLQQKYDQTITAFEDSSFGIDGLSPDGERREELANRLTQDKDTVLENLKKTKNYREAAKKLKELHKIYNENSEIGGIRSQKAILEGEKERHLERLKKKEITETDLENWENTVLGRYQDQGGFGFDPKTGRGKNIQIPKLERNIEDDMLKTFSDVAKGTPMQKITLIDDIAEEIGWGEAEKSELKTILEFRGEGNVARELYNFFNLSQNYKNYLNNRADIQWYVDSKRNPALIESTIGNADSEISQAIAETQKNPNLSSSEKEEIIADLRTNQAQLKEAYQEAEATGRLGDLAENIYKSNYAEKTIADMANAAADLYDVERIDKSTKSVGGASGSKKGRLFDLKESLGKINTQAVPLEGQGIVADTGTGDMSIQKEIWGESIEMSEKISKSMDEVGFNLPSGITAPLKAETSSSVIIENEKGYNDKIVEVGEKLSEINKRLNEGVFEHEGEEEKLRIDMKELASQKSNLIFNKSNAFSTLNTTVEEELGKGKGSEAMQAVWNNSKSAVELSGYIQDVMQEIESIYEERNLILNTDQNLTYESALEQLKDEQKVQKVLELNSDVEAYNDVVQEWRNKTASAQIPDRKQIIWDKSFEAFVGKDVMGSFSEILDLKSGHPGSVMKVDYNYTSRKIQGDPQRVQTTDIDSKLYDLENPRIAGGDNIKGDEKVIFSIARNKMTDEELFKAATGINSFSKDGNEGFKLYQTLKKGGEEAKDLYNTIAGKEDPNPIQRAALSAFNWERENPEHLYIAAQGSSASIRQGAEKSLIDGVKTGLSSNNEEMVTNLLDSYAAISLATDTETAKQYDGMAGTLRKALSDKNPKLTVFQTPQPGAYMDLGNGNQIGVSLSFEYSQELNQLVAIPYETTINNNGDVVDINPLDAIKLHSYDPTAIKKLCIYYGAGDDSEAIIDRGRGSFVPYFQKNY